MDIVPVLAGTVEAPPHPEQLKAGMRVARGPSWKWEKQDGGAGHLGTVKADQTVWNLHHLSGHLFHRALCVCLISKRYTFFLSFLSFLHYV